MPRTRTKFIWPPSNSNMAAPDESAAPGTSEPRPKRPRVSSHFSTDGQAVSHETTPGSSEGSLQAQFSKRSPPRELAAPALVPRVEYNPLAKSPIEQIRSYQRWRSMCSTFLCNLSSIANMIVVSQTRALSTMTFAMRAANG